MRGSTKQSWANGGMIFAATVMLIIGVYQIFVGIAAIAQREFFVVAPNYAYSLDTRAWGWIHVGIGIVVILAGFALYTGTMWAKAVAIALAVVSAVANFFFLPYYPVWSLVLIAMDVFVIWAVATARGPADRWATEERPMAARGMGGPDNTREPWPENPAPGRHYAADNLKEGAGTSTTTENARAEAMAHGTAPGTAAQQQAAGGMPPERSQG